MKSLRNKKNLLLDLDGTVYQDLESVFGQVSKLMTKYISEKLNVDLKKAKELQTNYFYKSSYILGAQFLASCEVT